MNRSFEDLVKGLKEQRREPEFIIASDVKIRPKDWLWEGHLLRGALELLAGLPGLGKSQVQINYAACVSAGLAWPDDTANDVSASVIMLTAEDTLDQEVVPRLLAAGANLKRIRILKWIKTDEKTHRQFLFNEDLDALEQAVRNFGDVALITVDPITAYMGSKIDCHKTTQVRSQLGPLKDLAESTNVAVSAITHPAKNAGPKAIDHFIGSQAFIAAARLSHLCVEEIDDDDKKTGRILFASVKPNACRQMPTLAYRIAEKVVGHEQTPYAPIPITAPHVVWDKEEVEITADEAVRAAAKSNGNKQHSDQDELQEFLREALKSGQPMPAKPIIEAATERGFTERQLRTARSKLGITSDKKGDNWVWQLVCF